ncbi:MAG: acetyl-CoA carboxylase biotin carboxyl carrier protein subunit [Bacteroidales bacterium]|jgi:biotin carboxyl carrier protein|nr:acetyl-CoA carboxylase biotin carboxyl carrier protein subunit [Bacteroidales bacterium]MBP5316431.1 acetyl-CoA carboxylase biotin carboxyl carrier protein subunit [Bacteroidales bacterium]MBR3526962.1 acetyl-CoA carboxylase biotin carboxyl carrier protein subunit [Bacteroidales bacterium]MCR5827005.1 acetyl-CoA carboxylase biotin carboxyl carrier protein subunit [Bacteroidales bacterium]
MKEYKIKINGNDYNVVIDEVEETSAKVEVNGTPYSVEFERSEAKPRKIVTVVNKAKAAPAAPVAPAQKVSAPAAAAGETVVNSPLPGVILSINKNVGDTVNKGDAVIILEAMKMENNIEATTSGKIVKFLAQKGDSVLEGAPLFVIG